MLFGLLRHRCGKHLARFTRSHSTESMLCLLFLVASKNVLDHTKPVKVKFITQEGEEKTVTGPTGQDILTLAHENNIDLEGTRSVISKSLFVWQARAREAWRAALVMSF